MYKKGGNQKKGAKFGTFLKILNIKKTRWYKIGTRLFISLSIFLMIPSKIVPQHKGQTLTFLINKLVNATPQTNST